MKKLFQKTIIITLCLEIVFGSASLASAAFVNGDKVGNGTQQTTTQQTTSQQTTTQQTGTQPTAAQQTATGQASAFNQGGTSTQSVGSGQALGTAVGGAVACSIGNLLSKMISSSINSAIGNVAQGVATDVVATVSAVPTLEKSSIVENTKKIKSDTQVTTEANVGKQTEGIFSGASWNAAAYCLINATIEYIADATIEWANKGFNGNPAFIDNPELFFESLADQEAGNFIQGLANDTLGVNVCEPFRVQVALNLRNSYSQRGQFQGQCTLDKVVNNIDSFIDGNFKEGGWQGWFELTQKDQNNPRGLERISNEYLGAKIVQKQNSAQLQLGWNKGYLSYTKCTDPKNSKSCRVTTPGSLIESQLEKTTGLAKDRLVLAEKFDQVIDAVVTNLIKVALNEALQSKDEKNQKNDSDSNEN